MWKRPVKDRDTTSCPLIASAIEFERASRHQADRWIKAKAYTICEVCSVSGSTVGTGGLYSVKILCSNHRTKQDGS